MPFIPRDPLRKMEQEEFHRLDYQVMRVAFDIHNDFGRFLDEATYKDELAYRLKIEGCWPIRAGAS